MWSELSNRQKVGIFSILGLVLLAGGYWLGIAQRPAQEPKIEKIESPAGVPEPTQTEKKLIVIHVSGAVMEPGVYEMPEGSRVMEAIQLAGGRAPDADIDSVNLARILKDGDQVEVKHQKERQQVDDRIFPISINEASQPELEQLPGIGPVIARRIIRYRDEHGNFVSEEDLMKVEGISEHIVQEIRQLIRFN
ncbi:MAG: helix-hairpin-helix domain-containing protein [Fimbriimonadaceae bacterium]|nr:MAG: helix-hairpin-helix domain-containing protein [Fimbriimonadaceae bacterium]